VIKKIIVQPFISYLNNFTKLNILREFNFTNNYKT